MLQRLVALGLFGWVVALAGCGGPVLAPPAVGNFSNASLKGTYAFAFTGNETFGFFSIAGSLQADGKGNIIAGVEDVNSISGVFTNLAIAGNYSVGADGRGSATLRSSLGSMIIDFVLLSAQHALVIRFDNNGTASGTIDLQDSSAFSAAALQGAFAFGLSGTDASGNALASAGMFSANNSGGITSGIEDFNDNGSVSTNLPLSGSFSVGTNGRGTAALTTASGTLTFAFYVVDSYHLNLVEIDSAPVLAGDAFRQQGTFSNATLSGAQAFTVGGSSSSGPFAAGGIFIADGSSGDITGGVQDINNNGSLTQNVSLSGSYSIANTGRGTLTLTSTAGSFNFVIYPSTGGLQMLEIDSTIVASGSALPQQTSTFSNASIQGNYGLNFTGVANAGEIDSIAEFSADGGGHFKGAVDFNNSGALSLGLALNGTYSVANNGRATATFSSSAGSFNMVFYLVSNSSALLLDLDNNVVAVGSFQHQ